MDSRDSKEFILDQTTIKKLLTIYKLKIPDFQRSFVWKQAKKQQLLDSLFRGFPIGAITLYEDKNAYYIIDGLQRINTLNQYLSRPSAVIPFSKFYDKIERELEEFLKRYNLKTGKNQVKNRIKEWYEKLDSLYEYEKVSILYGILHDENSDVADDFEVLSLVEELLDILKENIEIKHDDIALIIYKGDKNDLPDLFKNINTGSIALSQYEILQSVWKEYTLDKNVLHKTCEAFNRELELIRNDYEIDAVKEAGEFDIFKNIVGLNHLICCNPDCDLIFKFSGLKKLSDPVKVGNKIKKYYENDSIGFEIYSTLICGAPNKIVKAVDTIFDKSHDKEKITLFIQKLNEIIVKAIDSFICEMRNSQYEVIESKYHSLYVLAGIVFAQYDIDGNHLWIKETKLNKDILSSCLNLEEHIKNRWFIDENRQVGFFNIKIQELTGLRSKEQKSGKQNTSGDYAVGDGVLRLRIDGQLVQGYTVKEFYGKVFEVLDGKQVNFERYVPYATGKKRYLINRENQHITGAPFVSPIKTKGYYVETHKSKMGAVNDMYHFLEKVGVRVEYIM
ncbi:DUF262 domain-containing protein [Parablautia intestinalis]|uniref:DUF262 domain-containing protein n=1 Tax=Parablautia intestinalis TaxID=2320100 RepID=UPI00259D0AE4|nr:DUF262 domain-containing protein [Parablautia intestinalis]